MVCLKCGCEQGSDAQFCRQCGSAIHGAPPPQPAYAGGPQVGYAQPMPYAPQMRVRQNLQPMGILWCVFGAYRLVAMLIASVMVRSLIDNGVFSGMPRFMSHSLSAFMPMLLVMTLIMAAAEIFTGYSLLTRKPWARVLAIVMGILVLIKIPFGTALGIYTLWVLAPQASGAEWDEMTRIQV